MINIRIDTAIFMQLDGIVITIFYTAFIAPMMMLKTIYIHTGLRAYIVIAVIMDIIWRLCGVIYIGATTSSMIQDEIVAPLYLVTGIASMIVYILDITLYGIRHLVHKQNTTYTTITSEDQL